MGGVIDSIYVFAPSYTSVHLAGPKHFFSLSYLAVVMDLFVRYSAYQSAKVGCSNHYFVIYWAFFAL